MSPRVVLITGGASGIGAALAAAHRTAGDTVVVADIRPQEPDHVLLDVTDRQAFAGVARRVTHEHGGIDVFYNNAGIGVGGLVEELSAEHWDRTIDVNLRGVVHGIEAVYPIMRQQRSGHIVNTGSLAGLLPTPLMAPYTATKHAVVGLSQALRVEAKAYGVRVSVLCPGFVDTPILTGFNAGVPATRLNERSDAVLHRLRRHLLPPEVLAQTVLEALPGNPAVIVAPRAARAAVWAQRLVPWAVRLVNEREVRRYRR
jgi:NAD(P)-dependent dehydrogenase (short-subunit alcohol dehydrogenase family)